MIKVIMVGAMLTGCITPPPPLLPGCSSVVFSFAKGRQSDMQGRSNSDGGITASIGNEMLIIVAKHNVAFTKGNLLAGIPTQIQRCVHPYTKYVYTSFIFTRKEYTLD